MLDIDNGTRSPEEQVTEALKLLDLRPLDEQGTLTALVESDSAKDTSLKNGAALLTAKHEYVLRWLLNKQQAQNGTGRRQVNYW